MGKLLSLGGVGAGEVGGQNVTKHFRRISVLLKRLMSVKIIRATELWIIIVVHVEQIN